MHNKIRVYGAAIFHEISKFCVKNEIFHFSCLLRRYDLSYFSPQVQQQIAPDTRLGDRIRGVPVKRATGGGGVPLAPESLILGKWGMAPRIE